MSRVGDFMEESGIVLAEGGKIRKRDLSGIVSELLVKLVERLSYLFSA